MFTFTDLRNDEVKNAFSFRIDGEKTYVTFYENGKEYGYLTANVKIDEAPPTMPFKVYSFKKKCYHCHHDTNVLTYMMFSDNLKEDLCHPWNKERLLKTRSMEHVLAHMKDSKIEYYALSVVGSCEEYDNLLMKRYPNRLKRIFSRTQGRAYVMNVCEHCGAGQGWNYVYRDANMLIQQMKEIDIVD